MADGEEVAPLAAPEIREERAEALDAHGGCVPQRNADREVEAREDAPVRVHNPLDERIRMSDASWRRHDVASVLAQHGFSDPPFPRILAPISVQDVCGEDHQASVADCRTARQLRASATSRAAVSGGLERRACSKSAGGISPA